MLMGCSKLRLTSFCVTILLMMGLVACQIGTTTDPTHPSCVQRLMPCEPFLLHSASSSPAPDAACCATINQMMANQTWCLCAIYANRFLLRSFNLTHTDALNIVKACGSSPDLSRCKNNNVTTPMMAAMAGNYGSEFVNSFTHVLMSAYVYIFCVSML